MRPLQPCALTILLLASLSARARAAPFDSRLANTGLSPTAPAQQSTEHPAAPKPVLEQPSDRSFTLFGRSWKASDDSAARYAREIQLLEMPEKLRDDLRALSLAPTEWRGREWGRFGLGAALVVASSVADEPLHLRLDRSRSPAISKFADTLRPLAQEGGIALLAGAWIVGATTGRPRWVAIGQDGLEASLIASGLLVPAIKSISGRSRPRDSHTIEEGFRLFGGEQSFPSGEATQAFALASVLASHSQARWVQGIAYGVAGVVAANRLVVDGHWSSDVVAGAIVGTAVGRWVVRRRGLPVESEGSGRVRAWGLSPTVGPKGSGLGLTVRLRF